MVSSRLSLVVALLAPLSGCTRPPPDPPSDAGPEPDVWVGDSCGTIEGLDDPPVFVGSCIGPPDSNGDRGCMEVTTKPNAPAIGTECMRAGCLHETGNSWSTERCGGDYVYCSELRDDEGLSYVFYATNPAACGMTGM